MGSFKMGTMVLIYVVATLSLCQDIHSHPLAPRFPRFPALNPPPRHNNPPPHHNNFHPSVPRFPALNSPPHHNDDWVRVNGIQFTLNGRPYYVHGFNAFWLPYMALDKNNWPEITSFLERARARGFNTFRTNSWNNIPAQNASDAWQTSPGHYNYTNMEGLDFVISEAKRIGLKVLIPFGNNWPAYGGKLVYVQWAMNSTTPVNSQLEDLFFTNEKAKTFFKNDIQMILNRTNRFTGIKYSEEPAIFSWELLNEPRCHNDSSGNTLEAWTNEMSAFIKSIDAKHLLSNGAEGFYISNSRLRVNGEDPHPGIDFIRHNRSPHIDYASAHFYPKWFYWIRTLQGQLDYAQDWVREHQHDAHVILRKPVLFGEFGLGNSNLPEKLIFFNNVFRYIFGRPTPATGGLIWVLYGDTIPPRSWESDGIVVRIGELERTGYFVQNGPY